MDNEAPNYASWVPEAGGYVANGKVVSKSPMYDEQGKFKLDIDASLFNQPQVANTVQGNTGVTTANITGSGTDANAMTTSIGSGASLDLNTKNPDESVLSTPATKSPTSQEPILTPEDKAMKDIQDAAGRNDLQGMINGYVELGNITGKDYSTEIEGLTKQREQKIMSLDDQYIAQYQQALTQYNDAKRRGDTEGMAAAEAMMNQIQSEQQSWRDMVGYDSAMDNAQQRQQEDLKIQWDFAYLNGIKDIINSVIQLTGNYLNFQYDPSQDENLLRAQSLIEMRARNRASATGMYYSSTTQYAIAQAQAELIPIYEKMAKEEVLQQINLLQSTASFLMDMEQTQFNMWKSQIELQWEANQEKRRQWQHALDSSNARGYVNNEEAAILGVAPGSMSQAAREHAQALQEQIEEEERNLQQNIILAGYKNDLAIQLAQEEARLRDWNDANSAQRDLVRDYQNHLYDMERDAQNHIYNLSEIYAKEGASGSGADDTKQALIDKFGIEPYNLATEFLENYNIENMDLSGDNNGNAKEIVGAILDYKDDSGNAVGESGNAKTVDSMIKIALGQKAEAIINNNSKNYYGPLEEDTGKGINNSMTSIHNMITGMNDEDVDKDTIENLALSMYQTLIDSIIEYGSREGEKNNFDYNWQASKKNNVVDIAGIFEPIGAKLSFANQGDKAKEDAIIAIINDIYSYDDYSKDLKDILVRKLSEKGLEFSKKADGYAGLKQAKNWSLLNGIKSDTKTATPKVSTDDNNVTEISSGGGVAGDTIPTAITPPAKTK